MGLTDLLGYRHLPGGQGPAERQRSAAYLPRPLGQVLSTFVPIHPQKPLVFTTGFFFYPADIVKARVIADR